MTWRRRVDKEDAAFKEKVLPPAAVASLKDSRLAGISVGDPTSTKPAGGSSGGALGVAQAGGGEAARPDHSPGTRKNGSAILQPREEMTT